MTHFTVRLHGDVPLNSALMSAHRCVEGRAQRNAEALARHTDHICVWAARGLFEVTAGPAGEVHGVSVLLDNHARRCISLKNDTFQLLRKASLFRFPLLSTGQHGATDVPKRELNRRARKTFLFPENSVLLVQHPEQFPMGGGALRGTEKQITAGA